MTTARPAKATKASGSQAERADKYSLYQLAVQEPDADIEFIEEVFSGHFQRPPRLLREDFAGTGYLSCEWVRRNPRSRAWAVELAPEPLEWARRHNLPRLSRSQGRRLELVEGDVLTVRHEPVDVVVGLNFSFCIFKARRELLRYLRAAHRNLREEGLLVLDIYGGPEAQERLEETTEHDRFDYVWDQDEFDAIHNRTVCYIHFAFPDGSRLERAFRYDWRLWSVPELREAMAEAGFAASEVYWEGTDPETGEGDGIFQRAESAENCASWIAYVLGVK